MAIALDGSGQIKFTQTGSGVVALTTTLPDDVIVVIVANESNTADNSFTTVTSIADVAGLTWHLHTQLQWVVTGAATRQNLEVWWAHAPAALTADNITVTCANTNAAGSHPFTTDDSCVVAFGVSSADFINPFDSNGSLPASATDVTNTNVAREVTGISTTAAHTLMFSAMANSANQTATPPTGFTNIRSPNNALGSLFEYLAVDYKVQSSAQSGITVTEGSTGQNWGMIVDAIRENTAPKFVNAGAVDAHSFNTTVTPPLPASLVTGNLLVAVVNASTIGQARTFTFPGDWTTIGTPISSTDGNSAMAYRFVDGTETAPVVTLTGAGFGGADDVNGVMYQFSGVDPSNPIGAVSNGINGSNLTSIPSVGITLGRNNSLTLGFITGGGSASGTVSTPPTGYTLDSAINSGGTLVLYDTNSAAVAADSSPTFAATMSRVARWQTWVVEIASEAVAGEIDIPLTGTIANDMGFSESAVVTIVQIITASDAFGFSMAAAVQLERDLVASLDFGFTQFTSFDATQFLAASPAFGFTMAAAVEAQLSESAAPALGISMAASITRIQNLIAAPSLGFTQASRFPPQVEHKQPIVCVVS